jgi:hypothetical protein
MLAWHDLSFTHRALTGQRCTQLCALAATASESPLEAVGKACSMANRVHGPASSSHFNVALNVVAHESH